MCLKYLRANIYNNLVQYMYPDMFAIKTISHSLQNGIAHLGQNGIMMSHCIGLKNIKMQFVLSSHAYNISLTLFSRCTSLIVIIEK